MAKWTNIGDIRKSQKGNLYISFRKGVEITLNGEKVDLGEYGTNAKLFDAIESVQSLANSGRLSEEELTEKLTKIETKNISKQISVVSDN